MEITAKETHKPKKVLVGSPAHLELDGKIKNNVLTHLIMDLPFECNYNCQKCYRKCNVSIENLDLDLRKKIIKQAKEIGARIVFIAGEGEPLFHKELIKELVYYNNSLGLMTGLYTNGSLLDEETAQFLFDNKVILIVSIDSFDDDTYRELTGGGNIEEVRKNLNMVREIYKKGINKRPDGIIETRLGMITIACQQNKDEIAQLKNWCGDEVYFICNFPIKEGNAIKNWDKLVGDDLNGLKEVSNKCTDTGYGGLSAPLSDGRCVALYNALTIDTNGNILVCPASVKSNLGNIKDQSLEDLWEKKRKYVEEQGSPLCIAREIEAPVFKHHDGNVLQHL